MSKIVFIKCNSLEIREKLKDAGYPICKCASFEDAVWLDYHPEGDLLFSIHGIGYTDESEGMFHLTPERRIQTWLKMDGWFSEEREFYDTVDEFLEKYPHPTKNK